VKALSVSSLLYYCRSNYEADLAAELEYLTAQQNCFGYAKFKPKQGYVEFSLYQPIVASLPIDFSQIVFARQQLGVLTTLVFENPNDRVGELLTCLRDVGIHDLSFGDVFAEHADTDDGKLMAKFCKKFSVPMRNALRARGLLSKKPTDKLAYLHLFFSSSESCKVCVSFPNNRSDQYLGIARLKFPQNAPSRSTLKLEEAILYLMPKDSQTKLLCKGMTAVDLGACPGGWTYQMVMRGIAVEAIDNGDMADSLMQTGLVKHFAVDGFSYRPLDGHVDWLICDMIEKPDRVARLMAQWLITRRATSCIFNLKLPMQKRYSTVKREIDGLSTLLKEKEIAFTLNAKHLYHDRDEITVVIITGAHLIN